MATGQQAWGVADMEKWKAAAPTGQKAPVEPGLAELVSNVAFGLNATAEGMRLSAEARCYQRMLWARLLGPVEMEPRG